MRRALLAVVLGCLVGASTALAASSPLVRTAHNTHLKATILVDRQGMTLHDLSVERHGRFICDTKACVALWSPLLVATGVRPAGAVALGTVTRPDGKVQVTYKGAPLNTFAEDAKRGDTRGEGFKDVGTWHAAALTAVKTAPATGGYTYP